MAIGDGKAIGCCSCDIRRITIHSGLFQTIVRTFIQSVEAAAPIVIFVQFKGLSRIRTACQKMDRHLIWTEAILIITVTPYLVNLDIGGFFRCVLVGDGKGIIAVSGSVIVHRTGFLDCIDNFLSRLVFRQVLPCVFPASICCQSHRITIGFTSRIKLKRHTGRPCLRRVVIILPNFGCRFFHG